MYLHLLDTILNLRSANTGELFDNYEPDFFESLITHISLSIRFDLEHPMYSSFLYNALQERNSNVLGNIQLALKKKLMAAVQKAIMKQSSAGKIRNDVSLETMSFFIVEMQFSILEYLSLKFDLNIRENIRLKNPINNLPDQNIKKIVQDFVGLLKSGISKTFF